MRIVHRVQTEVYQVCKETTSEILYLLQNVIFGLPFFLVVLCNKGLKIDYFSYAVLKCFCFQLKTSDVFSCLCDVMCLVKNNNWVIPCYLKVFADLFVNQIVVRHKYYISAVGSILYRVVRAEHMKLGFFVKIFNIKRIPRHIIFTFISIFEVNTRIDSFLQGSTGCVQSRAFVHVDQLIYAEMVSRA